MIATASRAKHAILKAPGTRTPSSISVIFNCPGATCRESPMNPSADNTANRTTAAAFQLADLQVDPNAGEIQGPVGREKLDPKVMNVLVELERHAGQVVLR